MATSFSLKVLGGASIEGPDGPLTGRAAQRHRLALLALLAADPRGMTRDKLIALLWPKKKAERARHALSDSIYRINKALSGEAVVAVGDELRLQDDILPSDLTAFRRALEREDWEEAAEVYSGTFLDGFHLRDTVEFERWVDGERDRVARAFADALESLAEERAAAGDLKGAAAAWRRRADHDRYDSRVAVRLMEALEEAGNPAAALRHARVHAQLLEQEFGSEPDPEVAALADRIRNGPRADSGVAPGAPPAVADERRGEVAGSAAPDGLDVAADTPADASLVRRLTRWKWVGLGSVGALLLILGVSWITDGRVSTSEPGSRGPVGGDLAPDPGGDDARTMAVLPLEPLGGGPEIERLAGALHSDLITALGKTGRFRVLSRGSTLPYRAGERPVGVIADELDADLIVEGDLRRVDDRVRLNVHLAEGRTGELIWGDNMDRPFTVPDLFALQTEIVDRIVGALERSLTPTERRRIGTPPTEEMPAWQYYHRAMDIFDGTRAGNLEQERLLRRALEIDPSFAQAWASLSVAHAWRPLWTGLPTSAWDSAEVFALRALDEDPRSGVAYAALSDVYGNQGIQARAIRTARRAVELNPNDAFAHHRLGRPLHERGDFVEGLRHLNAASWLSRSRSHYHAWAGHVWLDLGEYRNARRRYEVALELEPEEWQALEGMAWLHLLQGRPDSALARAERLETSHPGQPGPLASAGMIALFARDHPRAERILHDVVELAPDAPVHARSTTLARTMLGFLRQNAGDAAAADTLLERSLDFVNDMIGMGAEAPRWPYEVAQIEAARGRVEDALDSLERAYDQGFRWAWMLERNPLLDPVRERPRFRGIVARIRTDIESMRRRAGELGGVELEELGGAGEIPGDR